MNDEQNYPQLMCWDIATTDAHCADFLFSHALEYEKRRVSPTGTGFVIHGLSVREVYRLNSPLFGSPGIVIDVTSIKRLLGRRMIPFKMLRVDLDQRWVDYTYRSGGCEERGITRLSPSDCRRPGVMIDWGRSHTTMVDGNHRLVRTWRDGGKHFEMAFVAASHIANHVARIGAEDRLFNTKVD